MDTMPAIRPISETNAALYYETQPVYGMRSLEVVLTSPKAHNVRRWGHRDSPEISISHGFHRGDILGSGRTYILYVLIVLAL